MCILHIAISVGQIPVLMSHPEAELSKEIESKPILQKPI